MNPTYLAIYPNIRGLAYVCVEMPNKLMAYGVVSPRPWDSVRLMHKVKKMLNFYQPNIALIRDANIIDSMRMRKFVNEVTECAIERNISVFQYSRDDVKNVFGPMGASTKQEIAEKIIDQWLPELADRRPLPRGLWEQEDYNMGIFDALALIMTHEFLG